MKTENPQCDNDKQVSSGGLLAYNASCFSEANNRISHIKLYTQSKRRLLTTINCSV